MFAAGAAGYLSGVTVDSPDPDPALTAGLEPGGGVAPGETPPTADSLSGAVGSTPDTPNQSPVKGNRTPASIALVVLAVVVLLCLLGAVGAALS